MKTYKGFTYYRIDRSGYYITVGYFAKTVAEVKQIINSLEV